MCNSTTRRATRAATQCTNRAARSIRLSGNVILLNPILLSTSFKNDVDRSVYVIELSGMHCIGYVCVTQRKDLEEELLRALLGGFATLFHLN